MLTKLFSLLLALALTVLNTTNLLSKDFNLTEFKDKLPELLGANNSGQEFWLTFNPCWETDNAQNFLKLYVSSPIATMVTVEIPGKGYIRQQMTVPNDIIEFSIPPALGQCYRKRDMEPPLKDSIFNGFGIHVYSEYPIICYGVTRYQYTSDGYLAIPVSSLGKEYTVASWCDISDYGVQYLPSNASIIAAFDQTEVSFTLGGTINSRTSGGMLPGETRTVTLNKGDVFLVSSAGQRADLTGSTIVATKPVSVISSNFCAYVPENTGFCDFLTEMEIPSMAWGKDYHYTPIYGRLKNSIIKIIAKEPETAIFKDNVQIVNLKTAGGLENDGWIRLRADIDVPRPIVFSGDKPIYIMQYNTGQMDDNVASDPFETVLTPNEQYQHEIIFNTPGIKNGLGFFQNYVNVVYPSPGGDIPDDLLFAQVENGEFQWKQLELNYVLKTQRFLVPINGVYYNVTTLLLPGDGVYKIKSNDPIAAYAYGFSPYDSYGFPSSAVIADLRKADKNPPDPKFSVYGNGTIEGGTVEDMPQSDDRSNLSMIVFHPDMSENYEFSYNNFIPGDDSYTSWRASVQDNKKDARLVATFSDRRGNDTTIAVNYYAPKYSFTSDIDFGKLRIGNIPEGQVTIFNQSSHPETFSDSIIFKYGNQGFEFRESPQIIFIPGAEKKVCIKFNATQIGEFKDSVGFWRGGNEDEFFIEVRATVEKSLVVDEDLTSPYDIYPNPVDELLLLTLNSESKTPDFIRLVDNFGNVVIDMNKFEGNKIKINTAGLASGMYVLQVGSLGIRKVVVVH